MGTASFFSPTLLNGVAAGSSVAGILGSGAGAYLTAQNQRNNYNSQAAIADINSRLMESNAQLELQRGEREQQAIMLRGSQVASQQRATIAGNGVDLGSATAQNLQASTKIITEIDQNTAAANAIRAAWGYRTQGTNYQSQAAMARASAAGVNPGAMAFGSMLSSASLVADKWFLYNGKKDATNDVAIANNTNDPIYSLGSQRGWW